MALNALFCYNQKKYETERVKPRKLICTAVTMVKADHRWPVTNDI